MAMKPMNWLLRTVIPRRFIAITLPPFGIYLRKGTEASEGLVAHEQVHWEQYQKMGVVGYYGRYIWQAMKHGYDDHPMEDEAKTRSGFPR